MTYAIKCLASIDQDHSRYLLLVHCFENVTSNKQTQGFGRVVFAIDANMKYAVHELIGIRVDIA